MSRKHRSAAPAPVVHVAEEAVVHTTEVDEVTEQVDTTTPPTDERPVKPVGTSNLACTIRNHRHRYHVALAPSGKKTANNGDRVARVLLATPLPALSAFVMDAFGKRYDHLNTGHERMCCGNLVRAAFNKGDVRVTEWLEAREAEAAAKAEQA